MKFIVRFDRASNKISISCSELSQQQIMDLEKFVKKSKFLKDSEVKEKTLELVLEPNSYQLREILKSNDPKLLEFLQNLANAFGDFLKQPVMIATETSLISPIEVTSVEPSRELRFARVPVRVEQESSFVALNKIIQKLEKLTGFALTNILQNQGMKDGIGNKEEALKFLSVLLHGYKTNAALATNYGYAIKCLTRFLEANEILKRPEVLQHFGIVSIEGDVLEYHTGGFIANPKLKPNEIDAMLKELQAMVECRSVVGKNRTDPMFSVAFNQLQKLVGITPEDFREYFLKGNAEQFMGSQDIDLMLYFAFQHRSNVAVVDPFYQSEPIGPETKMIVCRTLPLVEGHEEYAELVRQMHYALGHMLSIGEKGLGVREKGVPICIPIGLRGHVTTLILDFDKNKKDQINIAYNDSIGVPIPADLVKIIKKVCGEQGLKLNIAGIIENKQQLQYEAATCPFHVLFNIIGAEHLLRTDPSAKLSEMISRENYLTKRKPEEFFGIFNIIQSSAKRWLAALTTHKAASPVKRL